MKSVTLLVVCLVGVAALTGCFGKADDDNYTSTATPQARDLRYIVSDIPEYGTCTFAYLFGYSESMVLVGCK